MNGKELPLRQRDLILILIDEQDYNLNQYLAPYLVCQDGIAQAFEMLKNNVSREISILKEEGLIDEELVRVRNLDRKRKVYFTTEKGKSAVRYLIKDIKSTEIKVRKKGKVFPKTLGETMEELEKKYPKVSLLQLIKTVNKKGVLDIEKFAPSEYIEGRDTVEVTLDAPVIKEFYGRDEELEELLQVLDRDNPPIVIISGIAGIGKSSLGAKLKEEFEGEKNILWYNFQPWDSPSSFKESLAEFVEKCIGKRIRKKHSMVEFLSEVFKSIPSLEPMIFLDDCENISSELKRVLCLFLDNKKRGENFSLILMTREKFNFYDIREVMDGYVHEIELGPLKREDAEKMLKNRKDIKYIYEKTGGHPLYLELYRRYKSESLHMKDFIEQEIYQNLDENKKKVLMRLSLLWNPVDKNIILKEGESDIINELRKDHLIEETQEGKIKLHSLLKEFFYDKVLLEKREELHKEIAVKLEKVKETSKLEVLYYYEKGGDWKKSLELLTKLKYSISELDDELRNKLLSVFPIEELQDEEKYNYWEVMGDILLESGEWNKAAEYYERAIRSDNDTSEIREKLGECQMRLERWSETIETHKKAIVQYEKGGDKEGLIREYLSLGMVYRNKGDYKIANEYYQKVQTLIEEEGLNQFKTPLFNNLGILYLFKNEYKKAENYLKKALKEGRDRGITEENLYKLYKELGNTEEAIEHLKSSIYYYDKEGRVNDVVEMLKRGADYLFNIGKKEEAVNKLREALKLVESRKNSFWPFKTKRKMSDRELFLYDKLADFLLDIDVEESFKNRMEAINGALERGDFEKASKYRLKYAFDLHDKGILEGALKELDKVKTELEKIKNLEGITATHLEKARIYKDFGKYQKAKELLQEIIDKAEEREDEKAIENALIIMSQVKNKMRYINK
ncbi:MAG: tetratricopeptide repeat protein [Thermoplasmatota archaeon]